MGKPRPLFAVNEEVAIVCDDFPEFNTDSCVIQDRKYIKKGEMVTNAKLGPYLSKRSYWVYATSTVPSGQLIHECYLRKQPPLAKWEDCEFNPLKDKVGA